MRMVFSVLGLLLTVALVGWLVKQQVAAIKPASPAPAIAAGPEPAPGNAPAPTNQVQQVRDDVQKAMAQGVAATAAAASAADQ